MFNSFPFPSDALVYHLATSSVSGLEYQLIDVPTGETYTILGVSMQSRTAHTFNNKLRCDGRDLYSFPLSAQPQVFYFTVQKCDNDINILEGSGTPVVRYEISGDIVYVPYDIDITSMATTSPYTIQRSYDQGIYYEYNPLYAQVGIFIFIVLMFGVIYWVTKMFKKE